MSIKAATSTAPAASEIGYPAAIASSHVRPYSQALQTSLSQQLEAARGGGIDTIQAHPVSGL